MRLRLMMVLVLGLSSAAAACGSTNRPVGHPSASGAPGPSTQAVDAVGSADPSAASASSGAASAKTGKASGATSRKGGAAGGGGGTSGGSSGAPTGSIVIGAHFSNNANAAAQFGANRLPSEGRVETEAVVKWINAHGGMGGRKVDLVTLTTDPLQDTFDVQTQRACEFFRDNKAFAVVSDALTPSTVLPSCLAQAKIPLVWTLEYLLDRKFVQEYGDYVYQPQTFHGPRLGAIVDGLVAQGFLKKQDKIAIVRYDTPTHKEYLDTAIAPRFAAHGLTIAAEAALKQPGSASDSGAVTAQASSAVLDFQTKNINRVVFIPTGAVVPLLFLAAAESQGFHPLYGLSSLDAPVFLAANFKGTELKGARVVAWLPAGDVEAAQDPGLVPAAKRCDDAVAFGGQPASAGRTIVAYCESLFLLKDALDSTTDHTPSGVRKAIEKLGSSWKDPRTFSSVWGPGRHDAAAAYAAAYYDDTCSCFKYVSAATMPAA